MFDYHHKKYVIRQFLRLAFLKEVKNRVIAVTIRHVNIIVIAKNSEIIFINEIYLRVAVKP